MKEQVTGIGGVFFKARDPETLAAWYREHLAPFMINFRVTDLDAMLEQLRAAGANVDEQVEEYEYGRFGWATDPEGNRFELWEPANNLL